MKCQTANRKFGVFSGNGPRRLDFFKKCITVIGQLPVIVFDAERIRQMTAKRIFAGLFALITLLTLAGCTSPRLPEGRYTAAGRDDIALDNNELIFLHITTPAENPSPFAFWDWAGGYSLSPEGVLTPDMETELLKKWSFYYSFRYEKNILKVIDKGEGRPVLSLILEAPARR